MAGNAMNGADESWTLCSPWFNNQWQWRVMARAWDGWQGQPGKLHEWPQQNWKLSEPREDTWRRHVYQHVLAIQVSSVRNPETLSLWFMVHNSTMNWRGHGLIEIPSRYSPGRTRAIHEKPVIWRTERDSIRTPAANKSTVLPLQQPPGLTCSCKGLLGFYVGVSETCLPLQQKSIQISQIRARICEPMKQVAHNGDHWVLGLCPLSGIQNK
jgi:hypothetical protein